jgi:hypothetical protein
VNQISWVIYDHYGVQHYNVFLAFGLNTKQEIIHIYEWLMYEAYAPIFQRHHRSYFFILFFYFIILLHHMCIECPDKALQLTSFHL